MRNAQCQRPPVIRRLFLSLLFLALAGPAPAEFLDCTSEVFAKTKAENMAFLCEPIREIRVQAFGRSVGIRTLRWLGDETGLQYEPLVVEAAETTLAHLDGYAAANGLKVQDLTFLFQDTGQTKPSDPFADSNGCDPKDCVIRVDISVADTESVGSVLIDFQNTVAHEVFHCIQGATWPGQFAVLGSDDGLWWIEGTAQFIGHWIFPNPIDLTRHTEAFADAAQKAPLYIGGDGGEAAVFFAWLASGNIHPIFDFIKAMPTVPGPEAQRKALLAQVPPYLLAEFVRDFVDGTITMPGGYVFPKPEPLNTTELISLQSLALQVQPMTLFIHDLTFGGGTYMGNGSTGADISLRREAAPDQGWSGIGLVTVEQDCNSEETLRLAGMATGVASETLTLDMTKFPGCETCVVTETRDSCLYGSRIADQGDLSRTIYEMVPAILENVEVNGNFGVKFAPDGIATVAFYKLRIKLNYADTGGTTTGIDLAGSVDSRWSTHNQLLQTCYTGSNAAIQIVIPKTMAKDPKTGNMVANPATSEVMLFADLPMNKSAEHDFSCTGQNQMTMSGDVEGKGFTMFFNRAE